MEARLIFRYFYPVHFSYLSRQKNRNSATTLSLLNFLFNTHMPAEVKNNDAPKFNHHSYLDSFIFLSYLQRMLSLSWFYKIMPKPAFRCAAILVSLSLTFLLSAALVKPQHKIPNDRKGGKLSIDKSIQIHQVTVLVFFSPICPVCQSQTKAICDLYKEYANDSVSFIMIFPHNNFSKHDIRNFLDKYEIGMPVIIDTHNDMVKRWKVSATPEVVVLDSTVRRIYSGKINNAYESVGKYRTVVTEQYLRDAIEAGLRGIMPKVTRTEPVGCILNL